MKRIRYGAIAVCLAGIAAGMVAPVSATVAEASPGALMLMGADTAPEEMPIEIPQDFNVVGMCSQGVSGTVTLPDGTQQNIMVSAAHCIKGVEGEEEVAYLYSPKEGGNQLIAVPGRGEKMSNGAGEDFFDIRPLVFSAPDWATAELSPETEMTRVSDSVDQYGRRHGEPVLLTGVRDYRDLGEEEISFDNFGQPICKDGASSGRTCGVQFMRTRHALWSTNLGIPGDSGGINFDPITGEALGASSTSFLGLLMTTQPFDVALEEAYDIPDGQVNERFSLPDSTEGPDPVLTSEEYQRRVTDWVEREVPEEMRQQEEPVTMADAEEVAALNTMSAVGEMRLQAQDAVNLLSEDPAQVDTVVNNAVDTAEYVGGLVEETAQAYGSAIENLLAEEEPEEGSE